MSVARGASALGRLALSRSVRLSVAAFGTALLVALAGGCTSNAEPSPLPKPTASASPSPSATPSPPELPAEAEGTSPKAAKAFARFFVDSVNYAMSTGQVDRLNMVTTDQCRTCTSISQRIQAVYAEGGRFSGGAWRVRASRYTPLAGDGALVLMSLDVGAQQVVERRGASPSAAPSSRGSLELRLVRDSGGWLVNQLDAR